AQDDYLPTRTCLFSSKDGQDLYLDYYQATPGSETLLDGRQKPVIVFMFGGGFIVGTRNDKFYMPWFKMYNDAGYKVVSIDYRLGMKGVKTSGGVGSVKAFRHSAQIAAEDLFSATAWLIENKEVFGIEPGNIVISGSSAGAIVALEADWLLNNGRAADFLPEDFRYAGVMPFAGAIISVEGVPSYKTAPAPTAFFHGTDDKIVNYKQIHVLKWGMFGADRLARIFRKNGYTYNIYRYEGHSHEIASTFIKTFPEQIRFLEANVIRENARIVDSTIDDPEIPMNSGPSRRNQIYD
ncbi:MAG: alpha/beta hydrolase, partial [Bacteroidales bacterium]|nr:alpha/beta hydrolase [Bacteroidales bacterium]